MLDIKLFRENAEVIKDSQRRRGMPTKIVDDVIALDKEWRTSLKKADDLRHKKNVIAQEIASKKKEKKKFDSEIAKMRDVSKDLETAEKEVDEKKEKLDYLMLTVPNVLHESVPKGESEEDSVEIRKWGNAPKFNFDVKDHIDIGEGLDLIDVERAAKVSGARFYYLKNEAVELEFALARYALDILIDEGFTPVVTPALVRKKALVGTGFLPVGEEDVYKVEDEDLWLIGTSEVALGAMHMDEILNKADLPLYYCGFSSCFRTEAGSHGRDTKGIFRVHQFDKVEMFKFCEAEKSWEEHDKLIKTAEKIYQGLELHHRITNICTGDMGVVAAKKYDVEVWLPGQNAFRELVSCSNCTDYQSRRLNVRCRKNPGDPTEYVHTLNSTAIAIGRTIVAILENCQNEDGSVKIPKALQSYMGKKEIIKAN